MVRDLQMKEPDGTSTTGIEGERHPPHSTAMVTVYLGLCNLHPDWRGQDRYFEAEAQLDCDAHNEQCEVRGGYVFSTPRPLDPA